MKPCPWCGRVLPPEQFYRNRSRKDGLSAWCKDCTTTAHNKYANEHRDEIAQYKTRYAHDHAAQTREALARYRAKTDRTEASRTYYLDHTPEILERTRQYRERVKNPTGDRVGQRGAEFIEFTCEVCGTMFRRRKAVVDYNYERDGRLPRFCSRRCFNLARRADYKGPYARRVQEARRRAKGSDLVTPEPPTPP